jgi:hypothetical protein
VRFPEATSISNMVTCAPRTEINSRRIYLRRVKPCDQSCGLMVREAMDQRLKVRCGPIKFVDVVEENTGSIGDRGKRIIGDRHRQAGFFRKEFVDAADE